MKNIAMKSSVRALILFSLLYWIVVKVAQADPSTGSIWKEPLTGMEFVWIPKGCFAMGTNDDEYDNREKPVHKVCVQGFYLSRYDVTTAQYDKILGRSSGSDDEKNLPATSVDWNEARSTQRDV